MARTAVHVSERTHQEMCVYSDATGIKKGAIADRAVADFIKRNPIRAVRVTGTQPQPEKGE